MYLTFIWNFCISLNCLKQSLVVFEKYNFMVLFYPLMEKDPNLDTKAVNPNQAFQDVLWNIDRNRLVGISYLKLLLSSWRVPPTALNSLQIFRTCRFGKLGNSGCGVKSRKMFKVSFLYILLRFDSSLFYWISRLCNSCVICCSGWFLMYLCE